MRKKIVIKKFSPKPDPLYSSPLVSRLINKIMWDGKKMKAREIVYQAAKKVEVSTNASFLTILEEAVNNVKPGVEMKSRKLGGKGQRMPVKINEERNLTLALRLIKDSMRENKAAKPSFVKLAEEIVGAYNKTSLSYKKRETICKEAAANRVFVYF